MSKYTAQQLLADLGELQVGAHYKYVKLQGGNVPANECVFQGVNAQARTISYSRGSTPNVVDVISTGTFDIVVGALLTGIPCNLDVVLQGGGNNRSIFEALLANTRHVFACSKNRRKHIILLPSKDHPVGEITVLSDAELVSAIGSANLLADDAPWQLITYGAPGTGKSFRTKKETKGHAVYRTTFHPDSDYSTFVGAYKPTMSEDAGRIEVYKGSGSSKVLDVTHEVKKGISYDFVPQAFIKAYVDAWQKMDAVAEGATPDPVFLVIEEINRGNCAQIFGDLFQLLDRDDDGYSDYPIDTDADLKRFLSDAKQLGNLSKIREDVRTGVKLVLPPNLYIRATMNTSDQSLFPIDSAFKRRWEWKYVPIAKPTEAGWKDRVIVADGKAYDWWEFLKIANKQILDTTKSEDKQLGYFFVKATDATGHIKAERFAGKVLFYLYNDVFKDYTLPAALFGDGANGTTKFEFKMFFDEHGEPLEKIIAAFMDQLKVPNAPLAGSTVEASGTEAVE